LYITRENKSRKFRNRRDRERDDENVEKEKKKVTKKKEKKTMKAFVGVAFVSGRVKLENASETGQTRPKSIQQHLAASSRP